MALGTRYRRNIKKKGRASTYVNTFRPMST